jgi:ubiquinone/menaquinone biosynthesis C-methylase UbiE
VQTVIYFRALKKRAVRSAADVGVKKYEAPLPDMGYKIMSLILFIRDLIINHKKSLESAGIKEGDHVLDFGCGPGAFTFAASKIVGASGIVYALDNHHLSIESVNKKAEKRGISNINTIYTNQGETDLTDKSIDYVLLIGVLHIIRNPAKILEEIKRVMKDEGRLLLVSVHMGRRELEDMLNPMFVIDKRVNQMNIFKKGVLT